MIRHALRRRPATAADRGDTLTRIMPLPLPGETDTYLRDYRVGVAPSAGLPTGAGRPTSSSSITPVRLSDDCIDSVSALRLAGAADTIIIVARARGRAGHSPRDRPRRDRGRLRGHLPRGAWSLDGDTLAEARANVRRRAETGALGGPRSAEIIEFIRGRPSGAKAGEIEDKFGADGTRYVRRLAKSGKLTRPKRGLYVVSEPSDRCPNRRSRGPENSDTDQLPLSELPEPGEE